MNKTQIKADRKDLRYRGGQGELEAWRRREKER